MPVFLGLSLLACAGATVACDSGSAAPTPKVLVIGWDGVRADAVQLANTPNLDALVAAGAYSFAASTQLTAATVSAPGWLSLLTGVEADKHMVPTNEDFPRFFAANHPTFLKRARAEFGLKTAAACDWEVLCALILSVEDALDQSVTGTEEEVTSAMEDWLRQDDYDVHYVHIDLPDHAGHASGFTPENPAYVAAIEQSDQLSGRLLAAIASRPTRPAEQWLIAVVTDHGGEGTEHGALDAANRTIHFVLSGDGVAAGELVPAPTQMDLHATVLQYLGHRPQADWNLDGQVVGLE